MISIRFEGRFRPLKTNWWLPTKKEWAPTLMEDNREIWPKMVSADGKPWKSLSPSYQKWKTETFGPGPILEETGEMLNRASLNVRGNKFVVVTNEEGVYNQFGTRKMPARPWMGVPNKSLNKLSELAVKHILS
jgi:hypothetical protein